MIRYSAEGLPVVRCKFRTGAEMASFLGVRETDLEQFNLPRMSVKGAELFLDPCSQPPPTLSAAMQERLAKIRKAAEARRLSDEVSFEDEAGGD